MKISTLVELDLLRRYAEHGYWIGATDAYFGTDLEGCSPEAREDLHLAIWARDAQAVKTVVSRLTRSSPLVADRAKLKPLGPGLALSSSAASAGGAQSQVGKP